jgi:DNA-directed RNA polymerase specialized sigma24 family protein
VLALYPHWAAQHGLATAMLRDRHAGQDAVQDALVGVLTNGSVFADEAAALRYAYTAVLNQCRSALRRQGKAKRHLFSLGAAATVAAGRPRADAGRGPAAGDSAILRSSSIPTPTPKPARPAPCPPPCSAASASVLHPSALLTAACSEAG